MYTYNICTLSKYRHNLCTQDVYTGCTYNMYAYNTYAPTTYPEHMDRIHIHTAYRTHIAYILYNAYIYIYMYDTACTQHRTYIHSTLCTALTHI